MANTVYAFGPYVLDPSANRLVKDNEPVAIPSRQLDILVLLVTHAGELLSKDALVAAAWPGLAVTDNSLEQAISGLRRTLGGATSAAYIETAARRGYRFAAPVTRLQRKETVEALDALLAPHKAWIEGRAALETLERSQILHAREVFERVLVQVPDQAAAHVGLANACVLQFEMTRADSEPDRAALAAAAEHAREACRLDARYGEAWATLGFVLERTGNRSDALAASRMAVALEPDNWRHHLRLAYVSWGEERLRGARRALTLLPGFPLAHWLAATVHVAREALDEADRELAAAVERRQRRTGDSAASPCIGCMASCGSRKATSTAPCAHSSRSSRTRAAVICTRASAAPTPGMPSVLSGFVTTILLAPARRFRKRSSACRCIPSREP